MSGINIEIPREAIEQIAREVFDQAAAESRPAVNDAEAEEIARKLQRINAKQFITIDEFRFLFGNCSRGYVGKLLEKAQNRTTEHPVPYIDLDGLIQFERVAVLEWAREAKPLKKKQKKSGGKKAGVITLSK